MEEHIQLLKALHRAEVIYLDETKRNFAEAECRFLREYPPIPANKKLRFGIDHFLSYLEIRTRYDQQAGGFSLQELGILREGIEQYASLGASGIGPAEDRS
jgi:hypothetical protein